MYSGWYSDPLTWCEATNTPHICTKYPYTRFYKMFTIRAFSSCCPFVVIATNTTQMFVKCITFHQINVNILDDDKMFKQFSPAKRYVICIFLAYPLYSRYGLLSIMAFPFWKKLIVTWEMTRSHRVQVVVSVWSDAARKRFVAVHNPVKISHWSCPGKIVTK